MDVNNPNINPCMFWDNREYKWHLWREQREFQNMPWNGFETGFVAPDFIIVNDNRLCVLELKSCWKNRGDQYSYCLDVTEELRDVEEMHEASQNYNIIKSNSIDQWLERARRQSGNNSRLLEDIVGRNDFNMDNFEVFSYAIVCIIDFKERKIVHFQG